MQKGLSNGAISNQSLQLTLDYTELISTNVSCALLAENCVALWLKLVLEIHLSSFTRVQNCKLVRQLTPALLNGSES